MADRLHQPKSRIRMHLATRDKYDRVSAMFFILQDTLVKEVLYPPKDLENSFIYQLECRRKSQSSTRQKLSEDELDQECEEENESSEFSEAQSSRGFSPSVRTFVSHNFIHEDPRKPEIQQTKKNFSEMGNIASIRKRIGDGGHIEKKTSERNIIRTNPSMPKPNNLSANVKSSIPHRIENQRLVPTYSETGYRFRSYKNSRPTRVVKDVAFIGGNEEQNEVDKRSEEKSHHQIDDNRSNFSNYSVKSNFQGEVKSLREKFEKDCIIGSQKDRGCDVRNQQRKATSASNSEHSQPITVKRTNDVDEYTSQQLAQFQGRCILRPNTNEILIKSSQTNQVHNNKSFQQCLQNVNSLSYKPKQNPQQKQRTMIIRSNASNVSHSSSNTAPNRVQYGPQRAYGHRPTFDASKNKSNYEIKKSYKAPANAISNKE